jgi:cell division protein FtsL
MFSTSPLWGCLASRFLSSRQDYYGFSSMLRFVNICLVLGLVALAYVIYEVKYEARALDEEIAGLSKDIETERDGVAVLRAEWSLLNRPERIERLAQKYLKLAPARASQLVTLDTVSESDFARARVKAADQTVASATAADTVPAKAVPAKAASAETVPAAAALAEAAPVKTAPVKTVAVKTVPVKAGPVKTVPVKTVPVKTVQAETGEANTVPAPVLPPVTVSAPGE